VSRSLAWSGTGAELDDVGTSPPLDPALRLQRAFDDAYRYLARRDRTVSEVRTHLQGRRAEPDAIEQVVAEMREQGYLDDARYARAYAEDRRALDGWGPDRIGRRLAQAGIDAEHIEAALAERGPAEELEAAVEVLRQRLRVPPIDDRGRDRALGLLARRGFDLDLAYDAIRAFSRGS
jgi:regulatory protein